MAIQANISDFYDWLNYHLSNSKKHLEKDIAKARHEMSSRGMLRSSVAALQVIEICHDHLKSGFDLAIGEYKRAKLITEIDHGSLYEVLSECLGEYTQYMKGLAGDGARLSVREIGPYDSKIQNFSEDLRFALKHVETGFLDPPEPAVPPSMGNQITIGSMTGGAIQQGTRASTQNVTIKIDPQAVREGIAGVEDALKAETVKPEALASIRADLDTIKAQLRKPKPSQSILVETGNSLRSVIEGAAAGAVAPQLTEAMVFLGRTLGLA